MDWVIILYVIMFFFGIYFLLLFIILYRRNKQLLYDYPEPKKFPYISIIIPAYNEEGTIKDTLQSVLDLEYPAGKKEVIVVNDGSKDKTANIVKKFMSKYQNLRLIDKKNSGKADSLNQGIKIANGELIAVVDSDSYPNKDSLKKMVGYFEQDKKMAAVTSRVWVKKERNNFIEKFQDFDYVVIAWTRKLLDFIGCVYVTNGPLSIYRKEIVEKIGGFDTRNLTEDIEITWNILSKEYKTGMSYSTKVYTNVPYTLKSWIKQRVRWNLGGLQTLYKYRRFLFKHMENLFGYFIIGYVFFSFLFAILGFFLFLRYIYTKFLPYVVSLPYYFQGYNPFRLLRVSPLVTLLLVFAAFFFGLSLVYYKYASRESDLTRKNIRTILIYIFIYRPLYVIPLLLSFVKLAKRDIKWYTK